MKKINHKAMGQSNKGWLESIFHFSFAEYYNPDNVSYGDLRVINDDVIAPHTGFDLHPHKDMEIISYVVRGELTHGDSMGHQSTLKRGDVQYMSAGKGIYHSEKNEGDDPLRILQIWIYPDQTGYDPSYGEKRLNFEDREGQWLPLVDQDPGKAPIQIHQDAAIQVVALKPEESIGYETKADHMAYLVQIEGSAFITNEDSKEQLEEHDALEFQEKINIKAKTPSHIMVLELKVKES